jgi:hypothetical protein
MPNLTSNSPRTFQGDAPAGSVVPFSLAANLKLWEGAAVMHDSGNGSLINCVPTASGLFAGFCIEEVDNLTGSVAGGALAAVTAQVQTHGLVWLTVAALTTWGRSLVNQTVYASDGDSFTLAAGTNNILIGKVVLVPEAAIGAASAMVLVAFEASSMRSL